MPVANIPNWLPAVVGSVFGGVSAFFACWHWLQSRAQFRRREELKDLGDSWDQEKIVLQVGGLAAMVVNYLSTLDRRLSLGSARMLAPRKAEDDLSSKDYELLVRAGLSGSMKGRCLREGSLRLGFFGLLAGACFGWVFSLELAFGLGLAGLIGGAFLPRWAVRRERIARTEALERELPELLEVMGLGLRSGLTFDRSFGLYHQHFSTAFARACGLAQRQWSLGLKPRDQALRDLAQGYDSVLFGRAVDAMVRSLRFGTSLAENLESTAAEARADYKAKREEEVAKAPVKMMIPTGALILPAMLLMVLGPVLLELIEGF